jgi:hypothetical protein
MANLANNGDFSSPTLTFAQEYVTWVGWTATGNAGLGKSTSSSWAVKPVPDNVSQFAWLNTYYYTFLYQDLTFPTAGNYKLKFWTASQPTPRKDLSQTLNVSIGSLVNQTIYYDKSNGEWRQYIISFTVKSPTTARFTFYSPGYGRDVGLILANVSIFNADPVNLVQNGLFLSPSAIINGVAPDNWTLTGYTTGNFQIATNGLGDVESPTPKPAGIGQYLFFRASGSTISQNIFFPTAGNYNITYWGAMRVGNTIDGMNIVFTITGTSVSSQKVPITSTGWVKYSIPFSVSSQSTQTLSITTYQAIYNNAGALISGVSIVSTDTVPNYTLDLYFEWIEDDTVEKNKRLY